MIYYKSILVGNEMYKNKSNNLSFNGWNRINQNVIINGNITLNCKIYIFRNESGLSTIFIMNTDN
jgi:spore coat protein U-like protein